MNARSVLRAVPFLALATVPRALTAQRATARLDGPFDRSEALDGVTLFTVILTPKRQAAALPVILSRTP